MAKKFSMKELLNEQSKSESTKGAPPVFDFRTIPIDWIIPSPKNDYEMSEVEELADSIAEVGLLHNLVVKDADEEGFYEIVSGERRFRACKMLFEGGNSEFAELPCKVEVRSEDLINELRLYVANSTNRELTDYRKMMQAIRMKEILLQLKKCGHKFKGRIRENVAEAVGVSSAQMGRFESIYKNLDAENMEAFRAGEIGITEAYELSIAKPEAEPAETQSADAGGAKQPEPQQPEAPNEEKPEAAKPPASQPEPPAPPAEEPAFDTEKIQRAIRQMSVDQLMQLSKMCLQELLQVAIAKSTLAYLYPEAEKIVQEIKPELFTRFVPALAPATGA